MLEIRLQSTDEKLDLPPQQEIEWEELFHTVGRTGDLKSWQFDLPKTGKNKRLALKASLDAPREDDIALDVYVIIFGNLWGQGPLFFLDDTPSSYRVSFAGEVGYLLRLIQNKSIRSFDYPEPTPLNIWDHAKTVMNNPTSYDYIFAPVDLPSLEGSFWWPAQINSVVVDKHGNFDRYPEFWRHFEVDEFDPNRSALPSTTWAYLSGELVKFAGRYYRANTNVNGNEDPAAAPSKWDDELFGNIFRYNPMVPFLYVHKILAHIGEELGISFVGDVFTNEELQRLIFFNTVALNNMDENVPGTVTPFTPISYARHLPDVNLIELLRALSQWFNRRIEYRHNEGKVYFVDRLKDIRSPVSDTMRRQVIRMEVKHREKRTYNLRYKYSETDVGLASDNWTGTLEGVDAEEGSSIINSDFSTLPMRYGFNEIDPDWKEYSNDRSMDNKYAGNYWRPVSALSLNAEVPRQWLIYRKKFTYLLGPWGSDPELPMVSSGFDNGNQISDSYSLYWKGDKGLHKVWWESWIFSMSLAKVVRIFILMRGLDLNRSELLNRQALQEWVFLIETMKVSLKSTGTRALGEIDALKF